MTTVINDRSVEKRLIARRRAMGVDRYDEVWNGVYVMSPLPNLDHRYFATRLAGVIQSWLDLKGSGIVFAGANVSDRRRGWKKNFRCPDVAIYLNDNPAEPCGTHWRGGPDFAIEIVSPGDRSRKKLPFYAQVETRELLILDRQPRQWELYELLNGALVSLGTSTPENGQILHSAVLDLDFSLAAAAPRPQLIVAARDGAARWTI